MALREVIKMGKHPRSKYAERLRARFLKGVGEAEEEFRPSPFQEEALEAVSRGDVIVVAPTGSGKTWIAEQAIKELLSQGKESWYTTPLKALSNQKYENFRRLFGGENVGLLTGERRENPSAPIIVATTEVLRNALYGSERSPDFIVLDEAHYLGDEERGTTWEEVIILSSPSSSMLLLSATIANVEEVAGWMAEVRGRRPYIVRAEHRPVPLRYGFFNRRQALLPLEPEVLESHEPKELTCHFHPVRLITLLGELNLLPAIVFLPRRRDCDRAAAKFKGLSWPGRESRQEVFAELARENPYLWRHQLLSPLIDAGVASHHAGHLTGWKVAVERLLAQGKLRAVFATSTLAAGLDVPARTVVLPTLMVRDDFGIRPVSALEFHQMSGRAGRRGKDRVGFVILVPEHPKDLTLALSLKDAEPEPLESAFSLRYYQTLNLIQRFGLEGAGEVLERSFLLYQKSGGRGWRSARRRLWEELRKRADLLRLLGYLDEGLSPTAAGDWASLIRHQHSLVLMEIVRRRLCDHASPELLAGWMGSLAGERAPRHMVAAIELEPLKRLVEELEALERRCGLPPSGLVEAFRRRGPFPGEAWRRAACLYLWARGEGWERLVARAGIEEGDLQRLILQTAELLRQLEDLPLPISPTAARARTAILRPPVY